MENTKPTANKKKSYNLSWPITIVIFIILFSTNPTETQFKEFLKNDYKAHAKTQDPLSELLAGPTARILGLTTVSKNYFLFSTFEISDIDKKSLYVGILNHFAKIN